MGPTVAAKMSRVFFSRRWAELPASVLLLPPVELLLDDGFAAVTMQSI
jgi:hypothetical protein